MTMVKQAHVSKRQVCLVVDSPRKKRNPALVTYQNQMALVVVLEMKIAMDDVGDSKSIVVVGNVVDAVVDLLRGNQPLSKKKRMLILL